MLPNCSFSLHQKPMLTEYQWAWASFSPLPFLSPWTQGKLENPVDFSVPALPLLQHLKPCFLENCPLFTELLSGRWGGLRLREVGGLGSEVETMVGPCYARQVDDSVAQPCQREDRYSYLEMIFICRDKKLQNSGILGAEIFSRTLSSLPANVLVANVGLKQIFLYFPISLPCGLPLVRASG